MTALSYQPAHIEQQAQQDWQQRQSFRADEQSQRPKFYCLAMFPYPSGNLHVGHVRNYTLADVIARYQRLKGFEVLQPMGWDAFGLPAEGAAIKHGLPPAQWTRQNITHMRQQLQSLGLAYDWQREFATCDDNYYRWEQWLFIQLYKKGLAYRKKAEVNWDPVDQTVLANEQVENGRGWRSGALVERREIDQWFLRITDYADELLDGLSQLQGNWPEAVLTMQRNWIGRSQGVEVDFTVGDQTLSIYTTRPDTLMGVTYMALAAEHPLVQQVAKTNIEVADFVASCRQGTVSEVDLETMEKRGCALGITAKHPLTNEDIPLWVANFVLMGYGTGAVMAVPAHDSRDFAFAQRYQLAIKPVVAGHDHDFSQSAFTDAGYLINSGPFDGLASDKAMEAIADALVAQDKGRRQTHYRLRDWGISRQRYWGTPIPMIHCDHCGVVPVPEQDLPVKLPEDVVPDGCQSPLAQHTEFHQVQCPQCGKSARRDTDTFDTFMESSWYYARYTCPDQQHAMLDQRARHWLPVDQYVGGVEHAVMHLLYARFLHRLLRDQGFVDSDEPFCRLLTQGMVLKDGSKMSKSKGNVVDPQSLIERFGADTVRLFILFAAPPEQSLEWSDSGVEGAHRFLRRLWTFSQNLPAKKTSADQSLGHHEVRRQLHQNLQQIHQDYQRQQFNTVVSGAMKMLNALQGLDLAQTEHQAIAHEGLAILLTVLAPITPHISHVLWQQLGYGENSLQAPWPSVDESALQRQKIQLAVQVNGKVRDQITVAVDCDQDRIKEQALACPPVQRQLQDKTLRRVIVVPGRLVNIVCA